MTLDTWQSSKRGSVAAEAEAPGYTYASSFGFIRADLNSDNVDLQGHACDNRLKNRKCYFQKNITLPTDHGNQLEHIYLTSASEATISMTSEIHRFNPPVVDIPATCLECAGIDTTEIA